MGLVPEICAFLGGQGVREVLQVGGGGGTHTLELSLGGRARASPHRQTGDGLLGSESYLG